ncbi:hypothetical protein V2G26_013655 [Clonostachys chloroleuca]|uniref:Selenoprotein W-like protein n=1 Tax=Clonostachys chloroleuca TaxID=1926264 RepID=A0AA35PZW0_9HYPO|nr:unnamed protein product [Clonostachys chloroleuca]
MSDTKAAPPTTEQSVPARLPRVTIEFCTQCKWLLRAAYYAQELLSTFSLALGEVALQPSTGGTFIVAIHQGGEAGERKVLWDRRADGGFPETKELKRRIRDVVEPGRDLGHVDRHGASKAAATKSSEEKGAKGKGEEGAGEGKACEDCQ